MFDIETTARQEKRSLKRSLFFESPIRECRGDYFKVTMHAKNKERRIELRLSTLSSFYRSIRVVLFWTIFNSALLLETKRRYNEAEKNPAHHDARSSK